MEDFLSRHPAPEEGCWQPGRHRLQKTNAHRSVPGLSLSPSTPVKRGLVTCLFDRARTITTGQNNLQKEEYHLTRILRQNGYPSAFIHSSSNPSDGMRWQTGHRHGKRNEHRPSLVMLPYTKGVSEDVQRVCRKFCMKVVFRSGQSLRSMLFKVKDLLMVEKQAKVVYHSLQLW